MISFVKTMSFRLWLACILAMAIPLAMNIVLLNLRQYRHTLCSITQALQDNALLKANSLLQILPPNEDVLTLFTDVLDLDEGIPTSPNLGLSHAMQRMFDTTYEEISLIKIFPDGRKTIVASNLPNLLGKDDPHTITIPPNARFSTTLKQSAYTQDIFMVMQANIFDTTTHAITGILYTTSSIEKLLKSLTHASLPVRTAILSQEGVILKATDPQLDLHTIGTTQSCSSFLDEAECPQTLRAPLHLTPISLGDHFFSFQNDSHTMWGYLSYVPGLQISILSYGLKNQLLQTFWQRSWIYLAYLFCILLGTIFAYLVAKRLSRPIRKLATTMIASRTHPNSRYTHDPLGFEINHLGRIFNAVIDTLRQQQELAKRNYEIKENALHDLHLGEQAQQRLLPHTLPTYPNVELAKSYIPAINVGGDFFDAFVIGKGKSAKLFLIVADASGKGVYACGYSLFLKNMLKTFLENTPSIQEAVEKTASLFYHNTTQSGMFVTCYICSYCFHTHTVEFYSCGHPPAYSLSPKGEITILEHTGMALGFLPHLPNTPTGKFQLEPGSLLILYSDGITEALNQNLEMFGEEHLKRVIQQLQGKSANEAMHTLKLAIQTFVGDSPQHDDMTILMLKIS